MGSFWVENNYFKLIITLLGVYMKPKINLTLTSRQLKWLKKQAEIFEISVNEYIRRLFDELIVFNELKNEKKGKIEVM